MGYDLKNHHEEKRAETNTTRAVLIARVDRGMAAEALSLLKGSKGTVPDIEQCHTVNNVLLCEKYFPMAVLLKEKCQTRTPSSCCTL